MASLTLKNTALILGSMAIGGALTAALYARTAPTHAAAPAAEQQRKVLFWYDPMYPNTRFDKPGKSPFMDMDLVPKYADEEMPPPVRRGAYRPDADPESWRENRRRHPRAAALRPDLPGQHQL
jgi:hypothetical protein